MATMDKVEVRKMKNRLRSFHRYHTDPAYRISVFLQGLRRFYRQRLAAGLETVRPYNRSVPAAPTHVSEAAGLQLVPTC